MNQDEIQSPLPSREVAPAPEEARAEVVVAPTERVGNIDNPSNGGTSESEGVTEEKKKVSKGVIWGGIGVLVVLLGFVGYKFLLPMFLTEEEEKIRLVYWGLWEEESVIQGAIDDYTAIHPNIEIAYIKHEQTDYRSRLKSRLTRDPDEVEVPDIFRIHNTWVPGFNEDLAAVPITTANALELETDFFDVYKEDLLVGGSYKAVPIMYDGLSLFYNKELIESAQVKLPRTWWGLEAAANRLTVRDEEGKIKVSGVAMGSAENVDHWSDIVGLMAKQNGVDLTKNDEINNNKLADVLTYYTLFQTKHRVWDETLPSSTDFFANGKLAFYFGPSWRVFNFGDKNPNLKYEIMTVPQLPTLKDALMDQIESSDSPDNITNIHWASYWVEGVSARSRYQKEAWNFMEFLASKETLEKMYKAASDIRAFGEIYPRISMANSIATNPKVKPFITGANDATSWYLCSRTHEGDGVNEEMMAYFKDAINKITKNNQLPQNVVDDLRSGINQLVLKYQIKKK